MSTRLRTRVSRFGEVVRHRGPLRAVERVFAKVLRIPRTLLARGGADQQALWMEIDGLAARRDTLDARVDELTSRIEALQASEAASRDALGSLQATAANLQRELTWLAACQAHGRPERASLPAVLVSVVMPVRNRRSMVGRAIESVRGQSWPHWELLVVDDGSDDGTQEVLAGYREDARIRLELTPHRGVGAARNHALARAAGTIVAYLDSDNEWCRDYLLQIVAAFAERPELQVAYAGQLVVDTSTGNTRVRFFDFDQAELERENGIDLNAFAHRRELFATRGGFDESLTRLSDWDLVLRYCDRQDPLALPVLAGRYHVGHPDRISTREDGGYNHYRLKDKRVGLLPGAPKVLYALWHYPQLSESYVRWEIECMRRWGVEIEVWSEESATPPSPHPSPVPVHHGRLEEVLERVRPDLVHVHWSSKALEYCSVVGSAGLPMTVRDHAFDITERIIAGLDWHQPVERIYLFPHLAAQFGQFGKVRAIPAAFNGELYRPGDAKDERLVLRVGAAIPKSKALETFFEVATLCPDHRFVLALVTCHRLEHYPAEVAALNASLGNPVDLRFDVPTEELAPLVRRAGIYLHTHALALPFGMPMSIGEAMATGCHVLARRCDGAADYLGPAGALYDDAAEAASLIRATREWTPEQWRREQRRTVERAFQRHADIFALRPIVDDWIAIAASRRQ